MLLGIDIGGTTINLGLVEGIGIVRDKTVASFEWDWTQDQTIDYLKKQIAGIITRDVDRIGIGVPSVVDPVNGIVYNAANIPSWDEVHLKEALEKEFYVPVSVNNDSNCFALGAAAMLDGGEHVVVGITIGTGLGMGVIVDGKLLSGTHCGVGELGSARYLDKDFESYCSKKFFTDHGWGGKQVADAADRSDKAALAFFDEFGIHMGELLALVMFAYDPDLIVLGGGVANCYRHFKASMMETLSRRYPYANSLEDLRIEVLPDGDVPVIGASLLN